MQEPRASVRDGDFDGITFRDGLDAHGFLRGGVKIFDSLYGELEAVEHGLAHLLCVAERAREAGGNAQLEINGAMEELGTVKLFNVIEQLGNGKRSELVTVRPRHAGEAFQRGAHVARFVEDGFSGFALGGLNMLVGFEQRGIAKDDGEGVVELAGDVAGELAQADVFFGFDELLEGHGLAAGGLNAGGEHLDGKQVLGTERLIGGAKAGKQQRALCPGAAVERNGQNLRQMEALEVVAGQEPGLQAET